MRDEPPAPFVASVAMGRVSMHDDGRNQDGDAVCPAARAGIAGVNDGKAAWSPGHSMALDGNGLAA